MSLDATGFVAQSSKPCCVIDALLVRPRFAVSKKQWSWGDCRAGKLFVVFVRCHDGL